MSIRPLPEDVIQQIKSSITITTLNDVVIGLVKNSLDAAASRINISVDYPRGGCSVEDDGDGIQQRDFGESGGLGKHHHTSRDPTDDRCHGTRGDFVAALATFSLISITSRHFSEDSANAITIRNSSVLSRTTPSPGHQLGSFKHGTRVVVHDLFGSMAVRVKQRPTADDKTAIDKELGLLLRSVAGLVLAWPAEVSISIRQGQGRPDVRFRPPTTSAIAKAKLSAKVPRVLVQAGLADDISYGTWVSVGGSTGKISITGCVSMNAVATRRVQFLSMSIQPFANDSGRNALYDEINRVFANSDFSSEDTNGDAPVKEASSKNKKPLERWPMFYFCIERKHPEFEHTSTAEDVLNQPRTLSVILELLRQICFEFLKKHHFRPRVSRTEILDSTAGQVKSRSLASGSSGPVSRSSTPVPRPDSPFDLWQRVKVGRASAKPQQSAIDLRSKDGKRPDTQKQPKVDRHGRLVRRPFDKVDWPAKRQRTEEPDTPRQNTPSVTPAAAVAVQDLESKVLALQYFKPGDTLPEKEPSPWLKDILETWENPAFETTEARIPSIEEAAPTAGFGAGCFGHRSTDDCSFDLATVTRQARLSKSALAQAEVISQVDRKFILVKMARHQGEKNISSTSDEDDNTVLVLVDQHAADERCQLEVLMRDYFECVDGTNVLRAKTELLARPIRFEFGAEDCRILHRFSPFFEHWGVFYSTSPPDSGEGRSGALEVLSLPSSILERARTEPKLLADLLRSEAWRLDEVGMPPLSQRKLAGGPQGWVQNFQACPQGILDLLNSRSCRSAIMFNDVLDQEQCQDLVSRLSRCSFPFQCAHGRPSMAPLIDLATFGKVYNRRSWEEGGSSGRRMKDYMAGQ